MPAVEVASISLRLKIYCEKNTLLHAAALNGKQEVVSYLISNFDCKIIGNYESGRYLIHSACIGGNADLVRMLIQDHKADFKATDRNKDLPLHVAAENGREEVVLLLINEFNCDINIRGGLDQTLLHKACEGGNVSLVKNLIRKNSVDINANDYNNNTPLHVEARYGNKEVALFLINEMDCDVNVKGYLGQSLLHSACNGGNVSLVQTLIRDYKADISARDDENNTPLHVAALNGNKDVALFLLNKIDNNSKGYLGRSLLHSAVYGDNISLIKTLIHDYKDDINVKDDEYYTPLHMALSYDKFDTASAIITDFKELGFNINDKLPNGDSLMHLACKKGHSKLTKSLCKLMSPLVCDNEGNTPLHICSRHGHKECVELLLGINAPVLIRNNSGETPRDVARYYEITDLFHRHRKQTDIDYKKMQEHAKKKYSGAQSVRLFIIGNPGAGKSSLIESLKREGFLKSLSRVSESTVPPHTAGIVPSIYTSKHYGRVQFYDFAGDPEYYSSHAAILENLASSSKGDNIFILVTDLREQDSSIKSALHYWFKFIQNQKFKNRPSIIIIGSHSDLLSKKEITAKREVLEVFCRNTPPSLVQCIACFTINCCKPRSKEVQKQLRSLTNNSLTYLLSFEASILLGLLEEDFSNVTACPVSTLVSHIEDTGVHLPNKAELLHPILHELHEVGILLLIGDRTKHDYHIILNISQLTNRVHKTLFSKDAIKKMSECGYVPSLNIGIIPENILQELLPPYITKECLVHLQYCQEIEHKDIGLFVSTPQDTSSNPQSFSFFPALCSADKSEVSWTTPPDSYSIGWLAQCTDPHHYFPPRFLHVLLLRIVFSFTLTAPGKAVEHSKHFQRRCIMWKTGVHWLMEEGVECMVEMVDINKGPGVVIITRSEQDTVENCISIFNSIISCVMETMKEFCHSIRPQFFLLDSTQQDDYLSEDNFFAMSDVERVLTSPEGKREVVSITGKRKMKRTNLLCMRTLTHWDSLFPIEFPDILHYLKNLVRELYDLGLELDIPRGVLDTMEVDHYGDTRRRRRELVRGWMNSSLDTPCWWHLVEALRKIDMGAIANDIEEEYSELL